MPVLPSQHFTVAEFADPVTNTFEFEHGFIDHLELLRSACGFPFIVTSGCRSSEHLAYLKSRGYPASENSFHLMDNKKYGTKTCAVDIKRPSSSNLHKLLMHATKYGWTVGIAKTFIHLDLRSKYTDKKAIIYSY